MIDPSEQSIVNSICHYFALMRIPYVHIRNTGSIIQRNGNVIFARAGLNQRGISDFVACANGIPLAIEVKSRKGRLSDEQETWLKRWMEAGGQAIVARSLDDVISKIESIKKNLEPPIKTT